MKRVGLHVPGRWPTLEAQSRGDRQPGPAFVQQVGLLLLALRRSAMLASSAVLEYSHVSSRMKRRTTQTRLETAPLAHWQTVREPRQLRSSATSCCSHQPFLQGSHSENPAVVGPRAPVPKRTGSQSTDLLRNQSRPLPRPTAHQTEEGRRRADEWELTETARTERSREAAAECLIEMDGEPLGGARRLRAEHTGTERCC